MAVHLTFSLMSLHKHRLTDQMLCFSRPLVFSARFLRLPDPSCDVELDCTQGVIAYGVTGTATQVMPHDRCVAQHHGHFHASQLSPHPHTACKLDGKGLTWDSHGPDSPKGHWLAAFQSQSCCSFYCTAHTCKQQKTIIWCNAHVKRVSEHHGGGLQ